MSKCTDNNISRDKSRLLVLNGKGYHLCFTCKRYEALTETKDTEASLLQEITSSGLSLSDLFASQLLFKLDLCSEKQDNILELSSFSDQDGFRMATGLLFLYSWYHYLTLIFSSAF